MKFDIKDLPYAQFEQLGMSKKDVITMPPQDLADMLNGHRTSLIALKIDLGEGMKPIQADAKLSLNRNPDNTLSLGVHPILARPINSIDATPEQWAKMLNGEPIVKDSKSYNGTMEPHIHQLDKDTNEILSARVSAIQIPNSIKETMLTTAQKEQLKTGEPITLDIKSNKEAVIVRLDLNEHKGYKIAEAEHVREVKSDTAMDVSKITETTSRGFKM